jgi:hypothetical protein
MDRLAPTATTRATLRAYVRRNHLVFDARSEIGSLINRKK